MSQKCLTLSACSRVGNAEVQRRETWLKFSQAKSVGMLWMTVSTWPVSAVVSERPSQPFNSMVVMKIANSCA